jgi:hypothetical protein
LWQSVGILTPAFAAASKIIVPGGTVTSMPSIFKFTIASSKESLPQRAQRTPRKNFHESKRLKNLKTQIANIECHILDDLVKSPLKRRPGESRGPEHLEITGFRLSSE